MHVLLVKMSSLGDVIHTLPALTDAAGRLPGIRFDWAVEEAFAEIPTWHPAVDTAIPVALRRWRRRPLHHFRGPEWRRVRNRLRRPAYDAVIDAQGLIKSAFIARQVRAPRYGMDRQSVRERLASTVYHHRIPVPKNLHAVQRTRLLFARSLGYPLPDEAGDYGIRAALAQPDQIVAPELLFFHGTARAEKLWPESHWRELLQQVVAAGYRVSLPWGNEAEQQRARRIAAGCEMAAVLPRQSLRELAQRLQQVRAAVAVDTGLGHLSAALDVPTVSLYGPTSTRLVGAYGRHQVHLKSPPDLAQRGNADTMMASITPDAVWSKLRAMLAGVA